MRVRRHGSARARIEHDRRHLRRGGRRSARIAACILAPSATPAARPAGTRRGVRAPLRRSHDRAERQRGVGAPPWLTGLDVRRAARSDEAERLPGCVPDGARAACHGRRSRPPWRSRSSRQQPRAAALAAGSPRWRSRVQLGRGRATRMSQPRASRGRSRPRRFSRETRRRARAGKHHGRCAQPIAEPAAGTR